MCDVVNMCCGPSAPSRDVVRSSAPGRTRPRGRSHHSCVPRIMSASAPGFSLQHMYSHSINLSYGRMVHQTNMEWYVHVWSGRVGVHTYQS